MTPSPDASPLELEWFAALLHATPRLVAAGYRNTAERLLIGIPDPYAPAGDRVDKPGGTRRRTPTRERTRTVQRRLRRSHRRVVSYLEALHIVADMIRVGTQEWAIEALFQGYLGDALRAELPGIPDHKIIPVVCAEARCLIATAIRGIRLAPDAYGGTCSQDAESQKIPWHERRATERAFGSGRAESQSSRRYLGIGALLWVPGGSHRGGYCTIVYAVRAFVVAVSQSMDMDLPSSEWKAQFICASASFLGSEQIPFELALGALNLIEERGRAPGADCLRVKTDSDPTILEGTGGVPLSQSFPRPMEISHHFYYGRGIAREACRDLALRLYEAGIDIADRVREFIPKVRKVETPEYSIWRMPIMQPERIVQIVMETTPTSILKKWPKMMVAVTQLRQGQKAMAHHGKTLPPISGLDTSLGPFLAFEKQVDWYAKALEAAAIVDELPHLDQQA